MGIKAALNGFGDRLTVRWTAGFTALNGKAEADGERKAYCTKPDEVALRLINSEQRGGGG